MAARKPSLRDNGITVSARLLDSSDVTRTGISDMTVIVCIPHNTAPGAICAALPLFRREVGAGTAMGITSRPWKRGDTGFVA